MDAAETEARNATDTVMVLLKMSIGTTATELFMDMACMSTVAKGGVSVSVSLEGAMYVMVPATSGQ